MVGAGERSHCQGSFLYVESARCPRDDLKTAYEGRPALHDDLPKEREIMQWLLG